MKNTPPSASVYVVGQAPASNINAYKRVRVDEDGRLLIAAHPSTVQQYRSDTYEKEQAISSKEGRLVHIKGEIKAAATDDTTFYIHVLDLANPPAEDATVEPLTTLVVNHNAGFASSFATDGGRQFAKAQNGLVVALSTDRFTYDTDGLASDDQAYFEVDYLEA